MNNQPVIITSEQFMNFMSTLNVPYKTHSVRNSVVYTFPIPDTLYTVSVFTGIGASTSVNRGDKKIKASLVTTDDGYMVASPNLKHVDVTNCWQKNTKALLRWMWKLAKRAGTCSVCDGYNVVFAMGRDGNMMRKCPKCNNGRSVSSPLEGVTTTEVG